MNCGLEDRALEGLWPAEALWATVLTSRTTKLQTHQSNPNQSNLQSNQSAQFNPPIHSRPSSRPLPADGIYM